MIRGAERIEEVRLRTSGMHGFPVFISGEGGTIDIFVQLMDLSPILDSVRQKVHRIHIFSGEEIRMIICPGNVCMRG